MNEEFAISLKTILEQSSVDDVKNKLTNLKNEIQKSFENVRIAPQAAKTNVSEASESAVRMTQDLQEAYEYLRKWEENVAYVQEMMSKDTSPISLCVGLIILTARSRNF